MATKSNEETQMVLVVENSGNIGAHGVVGTKTRINYGRHKHGDTFLMHFDDFMSQPHRYVRANVESMAEPKPSKPEAPVPEPVQAQEQLSVAEPKPTKPVLPEPAPAPSVAVEKAVLEKAATPIQDDEIEVDITILPLVQIKQLGLSAEDAEAALELEMSAKKPRQSVVDYLKSVAKQ